MKNERTPAAAETEPVKRGILVVDDHPLFRKGVVQMLSSEPDLEVRAEAENSPGALDALRRTAVDLAVVDIGLHGSTNGIELTKSIKAEHPDLPVLVLSMHDEAVYAERSLRAGARGYVTKQQLDGTVLVAIRRLLAGETYMSGSSLAKGCIFGRLAAQHAVGRARSSSSVEAATS